MARLPQGSGLRPFLPGDTPLLAEIFRASVEELTADDYSQAQQAEWIARVDDEAAFGRKLAANLTLVATVAGAPVGFISLKGTESIDQLYVHPAAARQGIATLLSDALEKLAQARGARMLTVDASDSARDFYEKRGFKAQQRKTIQLGDEWLGHTTMRKTFAEAERKLQ